jgi:energy-coupling factor transporter transmembrane protein EcfT
MKSRKKILIESYVTLGLLSVIMIIPQLVDSRTFESMLVSIGILGLSVLLGIIIFLITLILCLRKKLLWKDLVGIISTFLLVFYIVNFLSWGRWYTSIRYDLAIEDLKEAVVQLTNGEMLGFDDSCERKGLCYKGTFVQIDGEMVVFMTYPGITDNWSGEVYDPTGLIKNGLDLGYNVNNWEDPQFNDLKSIFRGDLVNCYEIEENWYTCSFT